MKEITFLKQNHEKWQQFEALLNSNQGHNPDALADLFIRITDDLSWAHTFYPGSNTEKYLNDLAAKIHQEIYKNKKEKRSRIITFWTDEIPRLMAKQRLNLFITFLIFFASVWIGVISAKHDQKFVRLILTDEYVDMTLENMNKTPPDPLGVYKGDNHFAMFLGIAMNNSLVALVCIVAGIFGWLGVAMFQFRNGVMLGAFMYFLIQHGFAREATLTVWLHGVIEIWCIVVAGAAGMALGNSLWFPGAWPRGVSFRRGGREALKLGVGLIPFFFLAAFFEGFVTRYTGLNDYLRMCLIGLSLFFVTTYFIIYPFALQYRKTGKRKPMKKIWVILLLIFSFPISIRSFLLVLKRAKPLGPDQEKGFWENDFYMNPKSAFLFLLGLVLTALPVIALIGQYITHDKIDPFAIGFFSFCFVAAGVSHAIAFTWLTKVEEEDLSITRKISGKIDEYERTASADKI
ncbi:MAG TPA: stage II sporulation protein M [Bacteroidia bacterium]|nr:stage II sporulation protein M [Bacteroidia bacterium]